MYTAVLEKPIKLSLKSNFAVVCALLLIFASVHGNLLDERKEENLKL